MNVDVEDLLREGMERFTEEVPVPRGLAHRAARARRRRMAIRAAAGVGTAAVTTVAVIAATGGSGAGGGAMQARTTAYVVSRVEEALASQHLVLRGRTTGGGWGPSTSWSYGPRHRFEEFTGSGCGHALPDGSCTHRGESEPYLAQGTALVGGRAHHACHDGDPISADPGQQGEGLRGADDAG
jgi:hypothetical protein